MWVVASRLVVHALSTGGVRVSEAFLHARPGPLRQVRLFGRSPFSGPLPIHLWLIEHDGRRILVDTGETGAAAARLAAGATL